RGRKHQRSGGQGEEQTRSSRHGVSVPRLLHLRRGFARSVTGCSLRLLFPRHLPIGEHFYMNLTWARNWWSLVIRGIVGILLGIISFAWPHVTLGALVLLFGAYALITGVVSLMGAVRAVSVHERWGALLLEGIIGILAAVVTVLWPAITVLALVF